MSRPRVLIIKPVVPYPPDQGTKVVTFDLIRALRSEFDVTVLARALDASDQRAARELERWCDRVVTVVPENKRSPLHRILYKAWNPVRSLLTRRSLKCLYDCPPSLLGAAQRLVADRYDLIVVEYWQLYPLLEVLPVEKTILLTHDIDLLVNRQSALLEKRLLRKLALVRRWRVEQREEVLAYQRFSRILALTERDAHAARKLSNGHAEVGVLPFGVDPEHFAPPLDARRGRDVLFMGAMGAAFNRDALVYFARSIYPLLYDVDCRVTIVGGALPDEARHLERESKVTVVGRVDDVRDHLHSAACIVIPLRFGGGLRIRTIEAMMAGLPVICSTVAMAGMDFEAGRDFLLADTPQETAAAIARILDEPGLAREIAASARTRAGELYGPGAADSARRLFNSLM